MIDVNFDGLGNWFDLQENGDLIEIDYTYKVTANVFTLAADDERKFKRTKNLNHVVKLLPASHHDECELKSALKKYHKVKEKDWSFDILSVAQNPIFYIVPHEDNILELDNDTCAKSNHSSSTNPTTSNKHNDDKGTELSSTTREKMLSLIIGMAIDGFGYDPKDTRSPLTGDNKNSLTARLQRLELNVSADTIRDYLNEAKQYLPPEKQ